MRIEAQCAPRLTHLDRPLAASSFACAPALRQPTHQRARVGCVSPHVTVAAGCVHTQLAQQRPQRHPRCGCIIVVSSGKSRASSARAVQAPSARTNEATRAGGCEMLPAAAARAVGAMRGAASVSSVDKALNNRVPGSFEPDRRSGSPTKRFFACFCELRATRCLASPVRG